MTQLNEPIAMPESPTELLSQHLGLPIEQSFIRPQQVGPDALEIWVADLELWLDTFKARTHEFMGRVDALGFEKLLVMLDGPWRLHPKPLRLTYMVKHHFTR
jgi:hypothetical protein